MKGLISFGVATFAMALALCFSPAAYGQSTSKASHAGRVDAGQDLFQKNCLMCHNIVKDQVGVGPSLYHEMKAPGPDKSAGTARTIIENGKGKMPAFAGRLTAADTDDLLAYLRTL